MNGRLLGRVFLALSLLLAGFNVAPRRAEAVLRTACSSGTYELCGEQRFTWLGVTWSVTYLYWDPVWCPVSLSDCTGFEPT